MHLFCAKCGGELKHVNDGYKCVDCGKKYPQVKHNDKDR